MKDFYDLYRFGLLHPISISKKNYNLIKKYLRFKVIDFNDLTTRYDFEKTFIHKTKSVFRFFLQHGWSSRSSWSSLSFFWNSTKSDDSQRCYEFKFGIGH